MFAKEYQVEVESCLEKPAEESSAEGKKGTIDEEHCNTFG
jgi:hypothetical protein